MTGKNCKPDKKFSVVDKSTHEVMKQIEDVSEFGFTKGSSRKSRRKDDVFGEIGL